MPLIVGEAEDDRYIEFSRKYSIPHIWETNKIRKMLGLIHNIAGYPVRMFNSMDTYSGMMLWVPQTHRIAIGKTTQLWIDNYENCGWQYVILEPTDWEKTNRFTEWLGDSLNSIPIVNWIYGYVEQLVVDFDETMYPVYENLAFYNTINDVIIKFNYPKIRKEISDWILKKWKEYIGAE